MCTVREQRTCRSKHGHVVALREHQNAAMHVDTSRKSAGANHPSCSENQSEDRWEKP